jgi:hypothetical protein
VTEFWRASPFDLGLTQDEGNCDLCFLKGNAKRLNLIKARMESADWWARMESAVAERKGKIAVKFRSDGPDYAELKKIALGVVDGPGWLFADREPDGSCGEIDECRCTD